MVLNGGGKSRPRPTSNNQNENFYVKKNKEKGVVFMWCGGKARVLKSGTVEISWSMFDDGGIVTLFIGAHGMLGF